MGKVIQDIWILKDEGIVLFKRVFEEKVDTQLFGGFFSALNAFAKNIVKDGISNFEIADKKFYVSKVNNIVFIANCNKKIKPKDAEYELEIIRNKFISTYPPSIWATWDGNLEIFEDFEKRIKSSLEDVIKNFESAFW